MRAMGKTTAGAATAGVLMTTMLSGTAVADSPTITVSGGQCAGKWQSGYNRFWIEDRDVQDSDYCYIRYGWASGDGNTVGRFNHPQDSKDRGYYPVNVSGHSTIWWKLCKERQNDPDICTSYRQDVT